MKDIHLKPGSAEFEVEHRPDRLCDASDCHCAGEYPAPKSRENLDDYYYFCLDHIRDYNMRWDFCEGMTPAQIDAMITAVATWDRPTHRLAPGANFNPDVLRSAVYNDFAFSDKGHYDFTFDQKQREDFSAGNWTIPAPLSQEHEAMAIMGLEPPLTLDTLKARYKILAKKYHPDMTNNDPESEELIKKINIAYSILKVAYQKYTDLT